MRKIFTFLIGLTITIVVKAETLVLSDLPARSYSSLNSTEEEYPFKSDMTPNDIMKGKVTVVTKDGRKLSSIEEKSNFKPTELRRRNRQENEQLLEMTVDVSEAGKLLELLGDNLETVEALTVTGELNSEDFNTLWEAGYYGSLLELDLREAHVEGDSIPSYAMFHEDEQVAYPNFHVYAYPLRKLLLPDNVTKIGDMAFAYLIELVDLHLPDSLITIGEGAFSDAYKLTSEALSFPDDLESIGYQAFYNCNNLGGEIVFPQSLRFLLGGTFYQCRLTKVTFPETLEVLGLFDFAGCRLTEVYLPDNCFLDPDGRQFYTNFDLAKAHLPEHADNVPIKIFGQCFELKEVNIPANAKIIYQYAFQDCSQVTEITLPEGLNTIGESAFIRCALTEVNFPSTLEELGVTAFAMCGLVSKISCRALNPPYCNIGIYKNTLACPFGDYESHTYGINRDIPVYVPIGTKELYEQSPGWDYFTNFIETDFSTGVDEVIGTEQQNKPASPIYDIRGKRVKEPVPGQIYIRDGKKELISE